MIAADATAGPATAGAAKAGAAASALGVIEGTKRATSFALRGLAIVAGDIAAGDIAAGDIAAGDIVAGDIVAGDIVAGDIVAGDIVAGDIVVTVPSTIGCVAMATERPVICVGGAPTTGGLATTFARSLMVAPPGISEPNIRAAARAPGVRSASSAASRSGSIETAALVATLGPNGTDVRPMSPGRDAAAAAERTLFSLDSGSPSGPSGRS